MGKCDICGKNGKDLTLLGANHKELGYIKICSDCWEKLYSKNEFVGGTTSSSGSCPTCGQKALKGKLPELEIFDFRVIENRL